MVELVLAVWAVVLGKWLWDRRKYGGDSVGTFRRELKVLERVAPLRVAPAHHRVSPVVGHHSLVGSQPSALRPRPSTPLLGQQGRRRPQRRRLHVLSALAAAVVVTLAASVALRSAAVVSVQVMADVALAGYIGLLARAASIQVERRAKVAPIGRARTARQAMTERYEQPDYAEAPLRRAN